MFTAFRFKFGFRINVLKTMAVIVAGIMTATLTSCLSVAPPPQTTVLSRLPANQPGAAPASPKPLTAAERERYNAIDQWVMQEQETNGVIIEPMTSIYAYPTSVFYNDYSYYGGWNGWPRWRGNAYYDDDYDLAWPW